MLTKKDAKMAQGLAIIGMITLHLFWSTILRSRST